MNFVLVQQGVYAGTVREDKVELYVRGDMGTVKERKAAKRH